MAQQSFVCWCVFKKLLNQSFTCLQCLQRSPTSVDKPLCVVLPRDTAPYVHFPPYIAAITHRTAFTDFETFFQISYDNRFFYFSVIFPLNFCLATCGRLIEFPSVTVSYRKPVDRICNATAVCLSVFLSVTLLYCIETANQTFSLSLILPF